MHVSPWSRYPNFGLLQQPRLLFDKDLLDFHSSFENLGMAMLTLFRVCTNDNWSDIMAITSLELPLRPLGFDATVARARVELQDWVITGNRTALLAAQSLLSICQSSEELAALQDVITCTNKVKLTPNFYAPMHNAFVDARSGHLWVNQLLFF